MTICNMVVSPRQSDLGERERMLEGMIRGRSGDPSLVCDLSGEADLNEVLGANGSSSVRVLFDRWEMTLSPILVARIRPSRRPVRTGPIIGPVVRV